MTTKKHSKSLLTSAYMIMVLISFLTGLIHYMMIATLPLYISRIGGPASATGLMMGLFALSALVFRPVAGKLLDTRGRKRVLVLGGIVFLAGTLLLNVADSTLLVLTARLLHGIGFSGVTTAAGTIVSDIVPRERLTEGIAWFGIANTLATAAGPAVGLAMVQSLSFSWQFILATLLMAVSLICSMTIREPVHLAGRAVTQPEGQGLKVLIWPMVVMGLAALAYSSVITFITPCAASRDIGHISLFFTVYAASILITRLFTGRLAEKAGLAAVMYPGFALMAAGLLILSGATSLTPVLGVAVLFGLGFGTLQPLLNTLMIRRTPERRGAANAAFYIAMDVGVGGGSVIWGFIVPQAGYTWIYTLAALAVAAAALVFRQSRLSRDA